MSGAPASSFAELLAAWSTLGIGLIGSGVTIWQFRKSGFRPKLSSRVDASREACELRIINRGRTSGIIGQVLVRRPDNTIINEAMFEGFPNGAFTALELPAFGSMRLIVEASTETT